jgi:hypothetical protein
VLVITVVTNLPDWYGAIFEWQGTRDHGKTFAAQAESNPPVEDHLDG